MPLIWNPREWLKQRGVTRASQVRRIVRERTGYVLSNQAWGDLLDNEPKMLRVKTLQALCDAFYCCLSDFFEVKPAAAFRSHPKKPPNTQSPEDASSVETRTVNNAEPEKPS